MKSFEVCVYTDEFKEEIGNLIVNIQYNEFGIPVTLADQPDLQNIPKFYQQGAGNFWVAIADQQVVGTIALLDIGNQQAALRKMFVHASYRGKALGVGQTLLNTLLQWAQEKGIKDIFLGTTAEFTAAHRFYEKNAFTEISVKDLPANFPVMQVDVKFYRYS